MNFAERLVAGPPVLATVARRPVRGDLVVLPNSMSSDVFEVIDARPAIVGGPPGFTVRSLHDGEVVQVSHRSAVALTKAERKAALAHYASIEADA